MDPEAMTDVTEKKKEATKDKETPKEKEDTKSFDGEGEAEEYGEDLAEGEPFFPVTKVVLSKHGVGYFERKGKVACGSSFELFFKKRDMNDVLKSLTMVDVEGSLVSSISYESTKPAEEQLESISLKLTDTSSLRDLLIQLKGTDIALDVIDKDSKPKKIEGVVVGLEQINNQYPYYTRFLISILVGGLSVQFFDLAKVTRITMRNEVMQHELRHLLRVLLQTKKKDEKSITAFTPKATSKDSSSTRNILASYILEAPIWKTSFRLLLSTKGGKSLFQAWALVDNTQNEDWKGIDLYLTSGTQQSFIYDLYNPRAVKRQEVKVKQEEAMGPIQIEDAVAQHQAAALSEASTIAVPAAPPITTTSMSSLGMNSGAVPPPMFGMAFMAKPSSSSSSKSLSPRSSFARGPPPAAPGSRAPVPKGGMMKRMIGRGGGGGGGPRKEKEERSRSRREEEEEDFSMAMAEEEGYGGVQLQHDLGEDLLALDIEPKESVAPPPEDSDPFVNYDKTQASQSVEVKTETKDKDSAFQCKISNQVNIKRNQSALVPFLQAEFKGEKVAVYNQNVRPQNPLSVIKFPNTFGIPLEEGPLSIFEDDVYVGEAMLPQIKASNKMPNEDNMTYIAYSVELKCNITREDDSAVRNAYRVQFHEAKKKGTTNPSWVTMLHSTQSSTHRHFPFHPPPLIPDPQYSEFWPPSVTLYHWRVFSTTYIIDNKKKHDIKLILEHPIRLECQLIETAEPASKTDHFFRFVLDIKAESVTKFVVKERRPENTTHELNGITEANLREWEEKKYIENAVAKELYELVAANRYRRDLSLEYGHVTRFHSDTADEVRRVNESQTVVHKLADLLKQQEKQLHARQTEEEELEKKVKARKLELKDFVEKHPKMTPPKTSATTPTASPTPKWGQKKKEEEPVKKSPEEEAFEDHKKMTQRLEQDETHLLSLKRQNEEDVRAINDMNKSLAQNKIDIKAQVDSWGTALADAKKKVDEVNSKVTANRTKIDGLIKTIVTTGGDRFLGPEGERPTPKEKEKGY